MKRVLFVIPALLLVLSGCITIDTGGGSGKAPQIIKFEVNPVSITSGGAAIISWEVSNASSVSIDPGFGQTATSGSEKVAPMATTTYTITAGNKYGNSTATLILTVTPAAATPTLPTSTVGLPVIASFSANPSSVSPGSSAVLSWNVLNATSAKLSGVGTVATSGSSSVYPSTTTTYVLEAYNSTGQSSASTVVTVAGSSPVTPTYTGGLPNILSFSASPSTIAYGSSTVLSWSVSNAATVSITGLGSVASSGTMIVTPSASMALQLVATNGYGTNYATTSITVGGSLPGPTGAIPHVSAFYANPPDIALGASTTLTWGTYNASSVYIDNGIGYVNANGTAPISPHSTTVYTLTATNSSGSDIATTQVVVTPVAMPVPSTWPTVDSFYNSGIVTGAGGVLEAKLYWSVSNADSITIDHGVGAVAASGSQKVYPVTTTTYTLMASSGGNTVVQTTTVVVP